MASAPPVNPATNCPGCGAQIHRVDDRFCPGCGAQLMRPDLRARHINNGDSPGSRWPPVSDAEIAADPGAQPRRAPPRGHEQPTAVMATAAPLAPAAGWVLELPRQRAEPSHGLAGALGGAVVLALLGVAAAIILAVSSNDPDTPTISTPVPTLAAPGSP
jgi:hypothetical protein